MRMNNEDDRILKLLDGFSLLDDSDQERIVSVVDALDFACEKVSCNEGVKNENA